MATVTRDISLSVTAEVERYAAQIGKIPGMTQSAAAKAAVAMGKELAKAEQVALKAAGAVQQSTRSFGDMRQALGALSPAMGRAAADLEDLVGFLGPGGAVLGVAGAVGLAGAGMVKMTRAAAESSDELARLGLITSDTSTALHDQVTTLDAATLAWQAMSAEIAVVAGELLQGFVRGVAVASMALSDFFGGRGIRSLDEYVESWGRVETAATKGSQATTAAAQSAVPAFDRMASATLALVAAEAEFASASDTTEGRLRHRLSVIETVAAEEFRLSEERIALMQAEGAAEEELSILRMQIAERDIRRAIEVAEIEAQLEAQKRADRQKTADLVISSLGSLLDSAQQWAEGSVQTQKVLSAVEIALNSAVAGWRVFAEGGPFALPAAIATWGAGGISAAWAMSQAFAPPSQHPTPNVSRADRRAARRQAREDRRDGTASAGTTVEVTYRHRHYDDATRDALRRDSPLRRETRGSGQRSR